MITYSPSWTDPADSDAFAGTLDGPPANGRKSTDAQHRQTPIVHVKDNGNLVIQGKRVTDTKARAEMNIPGHEDVVEIDKAAIEALLSEG